jgi:hypothetical protein
MARSVRLWRVAQLENTAMYCCWAWVVIRKSLEATRRAVRRILVGLVPRFHKRLNGLSAKRFESSIRR